ncbi:MAG: 23S rRNA (uracil(1939)-C(5))-methyltransferase RlmD [Tenacibaculum sp.]
MQVRESKKFVKKGEHLELLIEDYAFGGRGIGRIRSDLGEFVVFVPDTLPGQLVRAKVEKSKQNYAECKLLEVIQVSEHEIKSPYQAIPGAPYINLPIEKQYKYKYNSTMMLFKKIGKIENIESCFDEFIASPNIFHYRNKMVYAFSAIGYDSQAKISIDQFTLGSKKRGMWWVCENLNKDSGIFDAELESNLYKIRQYCQAAKLPPWHSPKKKGFFRYLVVRKSYKTNQLLFNLVTTSDCLPDFDLKKFGKFLIELFKGRVAGFLHTINDEIGDRTIPTNGNLKLIYGKDKIVEQLLNLNFEISIKSFFQTNPKSAEKLYSKVLEYALEKKETIDNSVVMDLFCGTGTIGQIIASKATNTQIIGVDIVASAIEDARKNAKRNKVKGVKFFVADVGRFLYEHPEYKQKIKTVILDPARAGIAPKTLKKIINLEADRLVYVSCNPATQARDTEELVNANYEIKKISLVDQFPHTSHIETVVLFEK